MQRDNGDSLTCGPVVTCDGRKEWPSLSPAAFCMELCDAVSSVTSVQTERVVYGRGWWGWCAGGGGVCSVWWNGSGTRNAVAVVSLFKVVVVMTELVSVAVICLFRYCENRYSVV